jgi:hypothetical protein
VVPWRLGHITSYRYGWRKNGAEEAVFSKPTPLLLSGDLLQQIKKADRLTLSDKV